MLEHPVHPPGYATAVFPTEHFNNAAQRPGGGNHTALVQNDDISDTQVSRRFAPFHVLSQAG